MYAVRNNKWLMAVMRGVVLRVRHKIFEKEKALPPTVELTKAAHFMRHKAHY